MKLSEFTHTNIKCEQELTLNGWLIITNTFDKDTRKMFFEDCKKFQKCLIDKTKKDNLVKYEIMFHRELTFCEKIKLDKNALGKTKIYDIVPEAWYLLNNK